MRAVSSFFVVFLDGDFLAIFFPGDFLAEALPVAILFGDFIHLLGLEISSTNKQTIFHLLCHNMQVDYIVPSSLLELDKILIGSMRLYNRINIVLNSAYYIHTLHFPLSWRLFGQSQFLSIWFYLPPHCLKYNMHYT